MGETILLINYFMTLKGRLIMFSFLMVRFAL